MFERQRYCVTAHCGLMKLPEEAGASNGNHAEPGAPRSRSAPPLPRGRSSDQPAWASGQPHAGLRGGRTSDPMLSSHVFMAFCWGRGSPFASAGCAPALQRLPHGSSGASPVPRRKPGGRENRGGGAACRLSEGGAMSFQPRARVLRGRGRGAVHTGGASVPGLPSHRRRS